MKKGTRKNHRHPLFKDYQYMFEEPWCPLFGQIGGYEGLPDVIIDNFLNIIKKARRVLLEGAVVDDDLVSLYEWELLTLDNNWPAPGELPFKINIDIESVRNEFMDIGRLINNYRKEYYNPRSIYEFLRMDYLGRNKIDTDRKFKTYEIYSLITIASALTGLCEIIHTAIASDPEDWSPIAFNFLSDARGEKDIKAQNEIAALQNKLYCFKGRKKNTYDNLTKEIINIVEKLFNKNNKFPSALDVLNAINPNKCIQSVTRENIIIWIDSHGDEKETPFKQLQNRLTKIKKHFTA